MRISEALLLVTVLAIGTVVFLDQRAMNRHRLTQMLRKELLLRQQVEAMRQRELALEHERWALTNDPYYVERMVREELGWKPIHDPTLALAVAITYPPAIPSAAEGAFDMAPVPPTRSPEEDAQLMLSLLGYESASHFQRKMMSRHVTGKVDGQTVARASGLIALLQRVGCGSVKEFQARHGVAVDGILGRRTEQRLRDKANEYPRRRRPENGPALARDDDGTPARRPGG